MNIKLQRANTNHSKIIAALLFELLEEIMETTGKKSFHFEEKETVLLIQDFLEKNQLVIFLAEDTLQGKMVGFISLCECHALYTSGIFGLIPELFVQPPFRSSKIGKSLLNVAKQYGASKGWKSLEVTTPPLPSFDRTLQFYEDHGFSIAGGRKMKLLL